MLVRAHGRILFWEGASLWLLGTRPGQAPYPRTAPHTHHAVQLTLSLRGRFALETADARLGGPAAAVAPDVAHTFEGEGVVAHLFVDPEGQLGRALARALFGEGPLAAIPAHRMGDRPARLLAAFEAERHDEAELIDVSRALIAHLAGSEAPALRPELRVRKMIAWAGANLDGAASLRGAAAHVGISDGRARHLFVEQTGLPFRTYLLWLRLTRAVQSFAAGKSLTEAAHAAGFSDSAHLSRTFRRMFGISADSLRLL